MGGGAPHALYIRLVIEMEPKALKIVRFPGGACTCNEYLYSLHVINDRMMARKMETKAERHLSGLYKYDMMALDKINKKTNSPTQYCVTEYCFTT